MTPTPDRPKHKISHRGTHAAYAKAEKRRGLFIDAIGSGQTLDEACVTVGVSRHTYNSWRSRFPEFRVRVDIAKGLSSDDIGYRWQGDFIGFRKKYFGFDTYEHQARIIDVITHAAPGSISLINVPPEWGKTTLTEDYSSYRIAETPNVRITEISEGQPHARKILRRVQRRMSDPNVAPEFLAHYGPFAPTNKGSRPWSADFFTVIKADHDERDFTMEARGWTSTIAGTRTDLMFIDDIQSHRSLSQTDKMVERFRQDMVSRPKEGIIVILGTRVGVGDFYETIEEEGIVDGVYRMAAVNEAGESNCPEMWPTELLQRKREKVGEDVWWRNYMQQPRSGGAETFPPEMVDAAKDLTRVTGQRRRDDGLVVIGLDPALVKWNAFCVASITAEQFEILDVRRDQNLGSTENILSKLEMLAARYKPNTLVVEGNAYQKGLVNDERLRSLGSLYGFRIVEHTTHTNKLDEAIGVARMPSDFAAGRISIPWGDTPTMTIMEPLVRELTTWRADVPTRRLRQDLVMAMWFTWLEWQRYRRGGGGAVLGWKRPRLPWAPTQNPIRRSA